MHSPVADLLQVGVGKFEPGAGDPDEGREVEHLLPVAPSQDLLQRIGPGDEEQLGIRVLPEEVSEGVQSEGGPPAVDIHATDREARVGRGGDDGHQVAVLGRGDLPSLLLPGFAGGDEHDVVEHKAVGDLARRHEVTVVDGVEGAAHHSDSAPGTRGTALRGHGGGVYLPGDRGVAGGDAGANGTVTPAAGPRPQL